MNLEASCFALDDHAVLVFGADLPEIGLARLQVLWILPRQAFLNSGLAHGAAIDFQNA